MANEQELSTASFKQELGQVRFDIAWQVASAKLKTFGVGIKPPAKLDEDALAKMMVKAKKDLKFFAQLVDQKTVKVIARCGSESKEILSTPLNAGKTDLWIADLTALKEKSTLFSEAELKDFIKKHPDQNVISKLKGELATLNSELAKLLQQAKEKQAAIEAKKKAIVDAGGKP